MVGWCPSESFDAMGTRVSEVTGLTMGTRYLRWSKIHRDRLGADTFSRDRMRIAEISRALASGSKRVTR
jgi:hypothetical protein